MSEKIAFCSTDCPFGSSQHALSASVRDNRDSASATAWSAYSLYEHGDVDRLDVERFIAARFAERFSARVTAFMPRLFSLRDNDGAIRGAFGLRSANQRLFIERYLDEPIEVAIALRTGSASQRPVIVEVGHFCGAFPGAMRTMIALLAPRLRHEGFAWVVFAGTTSLCNAFSRVGMQPIHVRAAQPDRLPDEERAGWGSYYDQAPRVLIGRIDDGVRALAGLSRPAHVGSRSLA